MARRVFFSFHYDNDVWRANQVRDSNVVAGMDVAGFFGESEYQAAKKNLTAAIKQMVLRHLDGTSVTVVLIGTETANRPWVKYEIEQSIARKNGLLGIQNPSPEEPAGPTGVCWTDAKGSQECNVPRVCVGW